MFAAASVSLITSAKVRECESAEPRRAPKITRMEPRGTTTHDELAKFLVPAPASS
jgi:hypothetical protein